MDIQNIFKTIGLSAESVEKTRLGYGVVGKTTIALIFFLMVLGVAAYNLSDTNGLLIIGTLACIVFLIYFGGVLWFACKHPEAAILEGAEFITSKRIELAAKGIGELPESPLIPDPINPPSLIQEGQDESV